ncbi:hypothetical protein [Deinococcus yavapaiensis]|uniref:hypothetical protein n=1 Tax=Deinococcus yavapaiensis TaxID=309889 RepID=UPI0014757F9F|nr:hypothetical protein [Deinococcus yavapaiensis]
MRRQARAITACRPTTSNSLNNLNSPALGTRITVNRAASKRSKCATHASHGHIPQHV